MARVCGNIRIINNYLDQVDERNSLEKGRYANFFNDYSKLLASNNDLTEKMRQKERMDRSEYYNPNMFDSNTQNTMTSMISTD
jgi:WD40 repeat protein